MGWESVARYLQGSSDFAGGFIFGEGVPEGLEDGAWFAGGAIGGGPGVGGGVEGVEVVFEGIGGEEGGGLPVGEDDFDAIPGGVDDARGHWSGVWGFAHEDALFQAVPDVAFGHGGGAGFFGAGFGEVGEVGGG